MRFTTQTSSSLAVLALLICPPHDVISQESCSDDALPPVDDTRSLTRSLTRSAQYGPGELIVTEYDLKRFKSSVHLNADEIAESVGFEEHTVSPYFEDGSAYTVEIDYEENCYIQFLDPEKETYNLTSATSLPASPEPGLLTALTHTGPCGACSSLQDLAVYLEKRDLTKPVRSCALRATSAGKRNCIRKLGFSEKCVWIWFWNAHQTAKSVSKGGCRSICIKHITSRNNIPKGRLNPCKPATDEDKLGPSFLSTSISSRTDKILNRLNSMVGREDSTVDYTSLQRSKNRGFCLNRINDGPACEPQQYLDGPYRLNPCLQCDECRSGPFFKKISGRTRRASGIKSAIERPGVPFVSHKYFSGLDS